jgi:hypothetical protein
VAQALLCLCGIVLAPSANGQDGADLLTSAFDSPTSIHVHEFPDGQRVVAGEALVVLEAGADRGLVHQRLVELQVTVLGSIPTLGIYRIGLPSTQIPDFTKEQLGRIHGVRAVEWNGIGQAAGTVQAPDDTWYRAQWHLRNEGQSGGTPGADINMTEVWGVTTGSPDVVVAVLDTGIDAGHPEFEGRLLAGYDFVDEDDDPQDDVGHGTLVTGVLAATGDNAFGIAGMDWHCRILPIKVVNYDGTVFDLAQGIDLAASRQADVVNMSLGNFPESAILDAALTHAKGAGCVLVSSAGNGHSADKSFPGASLATLSIGATDHNDEVADEVFWWSSPGTAVDFTAPGVDVVTLSLRSSHPDQATLFSGTSAAAPLVSGLVSLMKAIHPGLTHDQAYAALRSGARDGVGEPTKDAVGWDKFYGHGRIDGGKSFEALCQCLDDPSFFAAPQSLTLGHGGAWSFSIDAGASHAGSVYLLLGSLSGTSPSSVIGATRFPLVVDAYTRYSLFQPNELPLVDNLGVLDPDGRATVSLVVPPPLPEFLGGLALDQAVAVWDVQASAPLLESASVVTGPRRVQLRMPPATVYAEDFEGGFSEWSTFATGAAAWHVVEDGECGASTRMAAFNEAANCSFSVGIKTKGTLISPSFVLDGDAPFYMEFDMIRDFAPWTQSTVTIRIVDESSSNKVQPLWIEDHDLLGDDGSVLLHQRFEVPQSSKLEGRMIHLEFVAESKFPGPVGAGTGWLLDNVRIQDIGALSDRRY